MRKYSRKAEEKAIVDNKRLEEAIQFAVRNHAGQFRKGTLLPYIVHPLETLQILYSMRADTNLLIAGVLHDAIEDTPATETEIRALFGDDVADLVTAHSEDKSKSWIERKSHAIKELEKSGKRLKMLVMADKVSNLRSMMADYKRIGNALWERFNAPCDKQAWYYSGIQDALSNMQKFPDCADVYWEMVGLYKDLFVTFCMDQKANTLYQISVDGTGYFLEKGNPDWKPLKKEIPITAERLERLQAERIEDDWNELFLDRIDQDLTDMNCTVYAAPDRFIEISLKEQMLTFVCEDSGAECYSMTGRNDYEFIYDMDPSSTRRFLWKLRLMKGIDCALQDVLRSMFGFDDGTVRFVNFCQKNRIKFQVFRW